MSISREIIVAYKGFGASMRRQITANPGEERLLIYLVMAILIFFIARVPSLLEASALAATEEVSSIAIFMVNLVSSFFFAPLLLYGIATLSHLLAKLFGGKGNGYRSRLALFWSLLVVSPLALVSAMLQSALPFEWLQLALSIVIFLVFVVAWGASIRVAEEKSQ